jgi:hypothetical protein
LSAGSVDQAVSGVERAVFGPVPTGVVDDWLTRHVRSRLGADVSRVLFRSGRISPVFGLRLADGSEVVVKVFRPPVTVSRLEAVVRCQARLFAVGYPCPEPFDGPAFTDRHCAVVEGLHERGDPGDAHQPAIRRAVVRSLVEQVELLTTLQEPELGRGRPAWSVYEAGPWPEPHDPIFDFTVTPDGLAWLGELAGRATDSLRARVGAVVTGHSDWSCQNLRFSGGNVVAAYDWDSLISCPEPVLAGINAGSFTSGGPAGYDTPTPDEVRDFLTEYDESRSGRFEPAERLAAAAAATWVLAYNARCQAAMMTPGSEPEEGSPLAMASRYGPAYLAVD